jgi:methylenetetrahydrofolate dehydrogenase (NADP+)/methenyltetrahydrofolate cyclohydrolase
MTAEVIDGRKIAKALTADVALEVDQLSAEGIACGLATVAVGDDFSASAYQRRLERTAHELGVPYRHVSLAAASRPDEVLSAIHDLNADPAVSGIVVLRPLPEQVSEADAFCALAPVKDIEAVHPENAGLLALGTPRYVPSTAAAAFYVLDTWLDNTGEDRAEKAGGIAGLRPRGGGRVRRRVGQPDRPPGLAHAPRRRAGRRGRRRRADPVRAHPRGCCGP